MNGRPAEALSWTISTLITSVVASGLGLLIALALKQLGVWPNHWLAPFLFAGFCGATGVYRRHRQNAILTLLVFVPVLTALMLVGTLLFEVYVLGNPIEL